MTELFHCFTVHSEGEGGSEEETRSPANILVPFTR